ncbi:MAG TPA: diguanylate cyclase [Spongiibacteraceae bacterium]|nr:diguanylate cyclase [Spongiibacteraceae bacterium]
MKEMLWSIIDYWLFIAVLSGAILFWGILASGFVLWLRAHRRRKSTDRALRAEAETIVEHVATAIWMSSIDGSRIMFLNHACELLFGCVKEQVYADPTRFLRLVHPEDAAQMQNLLEARDLDDGYEVNYRILHADNQQRYIRETGTAFFDPVSEQRYFICSAIDISAGMAVRDELHGLNSLLREANLRLRDNARRDNLTQCLNRSAFLEEAEKSLQLEQRYGRSSTLVFFDLNDFKQLNDNFGHHTGDRGLIEFAKQIKTRLRTTDELGRYGGDEFVVLLRETNADQAQQLLASLTPVVIDAENGNSIILRYSAGMACSDELGIDNVDDWLRRADSQMYDQKIRRSVG